MILCIYNSFSIWYKVLIGDASCFEIRQTGSSSLKTGELWVIKDLDYEKESFYLFNIIVTVKIYKFNEGKEMDK